MHKIAIESVINDPLTGTAYRLKEHLGQGGFGGAYRAVQLGHSGRERAGSDRCLKLSLHADAWHAEVYFAGLLRHVGHVVEMKSAFPTEAYLGGRKRTVFAIDMEWVQDGTVRDECERDGPYWTEEQIRRRVRLLLKPLAILHAMGVSHRDVTPPNVFIGNRKVLKLGDFGITKAQLKPSGVDTDVFNGDFAPQDLHRWWRPADDVYQVGLLMATLAAGEEIHSGVKKPEVNQMTEKGALRDAIKAAISPRSQRPHNAAQLAAML